jgi:phospholipid/cholesterol/gamma-HCH transport system substrate-binding protein
MPQRQKVVWAQLRVGLMVLISLIVLAVGIFFISGQVGFLSRRYELKTFFSGASGVREGSEVRLAGIPVGNVARIRVSPFSDPKRAVEIDMKISHHYQDQIRADSVATVETAGLLGEAYVDISRGSASGSVLKNGATVKGVEGPDITAIIHNANDVVSNLRALSDTLNGITTQIKSGEGTVGKLIYDPSLYNRINNTASGADKIVNGIQSGQGTIGKLMTDEALYQKTLTTVDHMNRVLDDIEHGDGSMAKFIQDPSIYNNVKEMTAKGNTLIDNINKGQGTLGKLVTDDQLYNRLNTAVAHVDTITARIDKGEGTLGKLSTDPSMYDSLNASAKSLQEFLTEFRKNPKKYLTLRLHIF